MERKSSSLSDKWFGRDDEHVTCRRIGGSRSEWQTFTSFILWDEARDAGFYYFI
jgi:hypothetical protein